MATTDSQRVFSEERLEDLERTMRRVSEHMNALFQHWLEVQNELRENAVPTKVLSNILWQLYRAVNVLIEHRMAWAAVPVLRSAFETSVRMVHLDMVGGQGSREEFLKSSAYSYKYGSTSKLLHELEKSKHHYSAYYRTAWQALSSDSHLNIRKEDKVHYVVPWILADMSADSSSSEPLVMRTVCLIQQCMFAHDYEGLLVANIVHFTDIAPEILEKHGDRAEALQSILTSLKNLHRQNEDLYGFRQVDSGADW